MPVKFKPTSVIVADLGVQPKGEIHKWFTNTCALRMDKYVPKDEGHLRETVVVNGVVTENVTEDTITYDQQYARYQYYGMREDGSHVVRNYTTPNTGRYWDKRMWSAEKNQIIKEVQNYIDKRGGK